MDRLYRVLDTAPTNVDRPIMYARCDVSIDLAPGTYWLDWMIGGSLTSGPWQPPMTILGQTTTGNSLQYTSSSGTWVEYVDSGTLTPQGLPFVIEGSADSMTIIDFDDLASITAIGTHYPGVTFSPGWADMGFHKLRLLSASFDSQRRLYMGNRQYRSSGIAA